jgi:hypothetical protein
MIMLCEDVVGWCLLLSYRCIPVCKGRRARDMDRDLGLGAEMRRKRIRSMGRVELVILKVRFGK